MPIHWNHNTNAIVGLVAIFLGGVFLSSCDEATVEYQGLQPISEEHKTPQKNFYYDTVCIDGVLYIVAHVPGHTNRGYLSVKFNRDGSVTTCEVRR